jgi:hypothetical protein
MSKQAEIYSQRQARHSNLTLERLGLSSWSKDEVAALQRKVGATPDGWFGPKSVKAWKKWARTHDPKPVSQGKENDITDPSKPVARGQAIINGVGYDAPAGLKYVNHLEENGIPAQIDDTSPRKHEVTQFVIHRGFAGSYNPKFNYAAKTEMVLDARGLSSSHSMDLDGTIYEHFDVGERRGRHATHHNVQSDSLDIGGPFDIKRKKAPGQVRGDFKAAIAGTNTPPLKRRYGNVKCWDMTPAQKEALAIFIPWWCKLRGIPLTACEDWRCFRLGHGDGRLDPVTDVKGILAHTQISGPGKRVDGILGLIALKDAGASTGIRWRSGQDFFDT